jgi:ABC-type dipeptide/oligopeptide/nickel transport system permease component
VIIYLAVYFAPGSPADILGIQGVEEPDLWAAIKLYFSWLIGIFRFDFGKSKISGLPVTYELAAPFTRTFILTIGSLCITFGLAVPIGVLSAKHRHPLLSRIASTASYLVSAAPIYWLGYIVIYLFSTKLNWFAVSIEPEPAYKVLPRFILMVFLLGIGNGALGEIIRHIREEVSNILQQEYIQAALARGANIWKHAGKNSVVPIIGIVTSHLTLLLGGAIVVEKVFSFPGIGYKAFTAADEQDYPIVLGITVLLVLFVRIIKIASDFICGMVDPRFFSGDSTKN